MDPPARTSSWARDHSGGCGVAAAGVSGAIGASTGRLGGGGGGETCGGGCADGGGAGGVGGCSDGGGAGGNAAGATGGGSVDGRLAAIRTNSPRIVRNDACA